MSQLEETLGHPIHPSALALLTGASDALVELDLGPLNSDAGHDAMTDFQAWRDEHPGASLARHLADILSESDTTYGAKLLDPKVLKSQIDDDDLDFGESVYRLDETILATTLAALLSEGVVEERAKKIARFAAERQRQPLVLERIFPEPESRATRERCLREIERLLEGIPQTTPAKAKTSARTGGTRKKMLATPWDVDQLLAYRLTSGSLVLLHYFADAQGSKAFYVLDWMGAELPPKKVIDELDIKASSNNLWKFQLALPDVDPSEVDSARAAVLARLAPIGVPRKSMRSAVPCAVVWWEGLEKHVLEAYDWP